MTFALIAVAFAAGAVIGGVVVGAAAASGRCSEDERVAAQMAHQEGIIERLQGEKAVLRHRLTAVCERLDQQREEVAL